MRTALPRLSASVLACVVGAVSAQTAPPLALLDPAKAPTQYVADAWGTEEGLPQSRVESIARSSDGHLWFGTQEGLVRFNGVAFEEVGRGADGLADADIRVLAPDAASGVWVGTRRGGLAHVGADLRVRTYGTEAGLAHPAVVALAVEPGGTVWAGTFEGLCRLDSGRTRFACLDADDGLPSPYVGALAQAESGALWVGTRGGLARVADGRVRSLSPLGGAAAGPIGALAADGRGGLWIGPLTDGPLGYLRAGRLIDTPEAAAAEGAEVTALLLDSVGSLWVGTVGAGLIRARGSQHDRLVEAAGADLSSVLALHQDPEGSLWIGTGGGGLARLRNAKFTPVTEREGLPADRAYAVAADPGGGVWVGTTGGLARVEGNRVTRTVGAADGLLGDDVSAVYATRDGTVWAGVEGEGLCRVLPDRVAQCVTPGAGLPDPYTIAFEETADGTLWVGTGTGLSRWTGSGLTPLDAPGAPDAPVTALAEGSGGTLWIGTYGAGLHRYDGAAVTPVVGTEDDDILTLHVRAGGEVWAGTDGAGLLLIDTRAAAPPDVHRLGAPQGLPSQIVMQILEDGQGRLWVTSNRGVAVAAAGALAAAARAGRAVGLTLYGRADGLPSAEANGGSQPAGARARDGTLYFPTNGGVAVVDPARIPVNQTAPPVVVGLRVDGEPVPADGGVVSLAPDADDVEFRYAGLSFFSPDRVRHQFKLDGRDAEWTDAGARRAAYYTDLPPGDYAFRVRAANEDGVWSESAAALAFTVRPHVWETRWFMALCGLLVVGVVFGAYKARTAQLRARQRQLEATVAERTAELADEKAQVEQLNGQLSDLNATLQDQVREQLREIVRGSRLRKYFPQKVVDRILNQEEDVAVAAERRPVTVVFTDLAGFTRLSETTPPDEVTALLNEYLNEMVALIDAHGGTLDKFMGDGVMVLFGAADPMPEAEQARRAVQMAAAMQRAMARLRAGWAARGRDLDLRIGVHQAVVTVGNFGSDDLVEFTAIGRGVNLAARLEGACAPGGVLVSREVHALTAGDAAYRPARELTLKGIEGTVPAYPLDLADAAPPVPTAAAVSPGPG